MSYLSNGGQSARELTDAEMTNISGGQFYESETMAHTTINCYPTSDGGKVCAAKTDPD